MPEPQGICPADAAAVHKMKQLLSCRILTGSRMGWHEEGHSASANLHEFAGWPEFACLSKSVAVVRSNLHAAV